MDPYLAAYRLTTAPGVGPGMTARVLGKFGSLHALLGKNPKTLEGQAERVRAALDQPRRGEADEIASWQALDCRVYSRFAPDYPGRLLRLADPPLLLFVLGALPDAWPAPNIVIVGSRRATPYGRGAAAKLAGELVAAGAIVGSGLAYGVDAAAHEGALEAAGKTWAAVGHGIDLIYPAEHAYLKQQIVEDGGSVIAEYPPGTAVQVHHFPARNRLLAAMADAVVVIEGAKRSGALITAELALDLGVPVLALPGRVGDRQAEAPLSLIKQGAMPAMDAETVLEAAGWRLQSRPDTLPMGPENQGPLFEQIPSTGAIHVDELAIALKLPLTVILNDLLQLELAGWVQTLPGKFVSRANPGRAQR